MIRDERWENVRGYWGPLSKLRFDIDDPPNVDLWVLRLEVTYAGMFTWIETMVHPDDLDIIQTPEAFGYLLGQSIFSMDSRLASIANPKSEHVCGGPVVDDISTCVERPFHGTPCRDARGRVRYKEEELNE